MSNLPPSNLQPPKRGIGFRYAANGLGLAARGRNFRIELGCAALAVVCALALRVTSGALAAILIVSGLVLAAEAFNSALEILCDLVCKGAYDARVKAVKDIGAGAVLLASIVALATGLAVFLPKILSIAGIN